MATICELCKLLDNPLRLEMLSRVCGARDGMNVGVLVDEMSQSGLGQSGVSQYLKQLAALGVIRRERAGKYVNYVRGRTDSRAVDAAVDAIVERMRQKGDLGFARVFGALMNPFRAAVVAAVARAGTLSAVGICERFRHQMKYLKRDLQEAVDAGLIDPDDSDSSVANYRYLEPSDPIVRQLVSSVSSDHLL